MLYLQKRGMFEGSKSLINLISGFCLIVLGGVQLLQQIGVLSWGLPDIPKVVLEVFLGVCGFYLVIDGFLVITMHPMLTMADILFGLSIAAMGLLPLLNQLTGIFYPMAFINVIIIDICFVISGILLIMNSWNF